MNATIFHIPHASTFIPDRYLSGFLPGLEENLLRMTDWYTDELFDFGFGDRLVYPVSRLVCDPERFRVDEREEMAQIGNAKAAQIVRDASSSRRPEGEHQNGRLLCQIR